MTPLVNEIDALISLLRSYRFRFTCEADLQRGLEAVLRTRKDVVREHSFDEENRADFFIPSLGLAIEVKTRGSAAAVLEQVSRYSSLPQVRAVLVVSSRIQLAHLPVTLNDKPLRVLTLAGSVL